MDSKSDSSSCRASFISSCSQSSDTPFVTAPAVEPYSPSLSNVIISEPYPPSSCGENNKELNESTADSNVLEVIDVTDQLVFRKPVSLNCSYFSGCLDAWMLLKSSVRIVVSLQLCSCTS